MRALAAALPAVVAGRCDVDARKAQYGAWLCGAVLAATDDVAEARARHTLGGPLDLPHAQTHTVVLPMRSRRPAALKAAIPRIAQLAVAHPWRGLGR